MLLLSSSSQLELEKYELGDKISMPHLIKLQLLAEEEISRLQHHLDECRVLKLDETEEERRGERRVKRERDMGGNAERWEGSEWHNQC